LPLPRWRALGMLVVHTCIKNHCRSSSELQFWNTATDLSAWLCPAGTSYPHRDCSCPDALLRQHRHPSCSVPLVQAD
jgi:hypothetical protein